MIDPSNENNSFSLVTPGMQFAVDSTSIGAFKTCPRYYQYTVAMGLRSRVESPHLTFGILLHQAREHYEHAKSAGLCHDDALDKVLDFVLCNSWDREMRRPWISDHNIKNRKTLVQTVVWYLDDKANNDSLETVQLANGKPAVELSFRFGTGISTSKGEEIIACGHLDRLAKLGNSIYVSDIKTSSSAVDARWLAQFSPHNQFSLYTIAGKIAFGFEIEGVIVDGVQVGVGFARFQRHLVGRSQAQLDEYMRGFAYTIRQMEVCATQQWWPMNETSCDKFGGCPMRSICSKSPASRELFIKQSFSKKIWDPLQIRGDI